MVGSGWLGSSPVCARWWEGRRELVRVGFLWLLLGGLSLYPRIMLSMCVRNGSSANVIILQRSTCVSSFVCYGLSFNGGVCLRLWRPCTIFRVMFKLCAVPSVCCRFGC